MNDTIRKERLISKDYLLIMLAATGTSLCNFFFFTALPLYAAKITGSNVYGGLMLTVYSIAALVARPITGLISDRFGRVKLLIVGALMCAAACALYGVTTAIILILGIRLINGIGFGMHSTSAGAVVADVIPKSRMSEGLGYFNLYATVATAVGPYIALKIVADDEIFSYQKLFFLASGLCLMSMISDCFISYERKAKKKRLAETAVTKESNEPVEEFEEISVQEPGQPSAPLPKTFFGFEYAVFLPVAVLVLMNFASSSINTFLTLFAKDRAMGDIGIFFTINAVGLLISRLLFGRLADRRGPDVVVIPGIAGMAVCYALISFVHTPMWLYILAFPIGLAGGAIMPTINALIFNRCSPQRRGTAAGAFYAALDIGFTLGGTIFGFVADGIGFGYVYWIAAILAAAACVLYIKAVSDKKYKRLKAL